MSVYESVSWVIALAVKWEWIADDSDMMCCRYLHHQPEKDVGETAVCCARNCSDWEPSGRVCHLSKAVWTTSRSQVCFVHWSNSDCWSFHARNVYQPDPGLNSFCASMWAWEKCGMHKVVCWILLWNQTLTRRDLIHVCIPQFACCKLDSTFDRSPFSIVGWQYSGIFPVKCPFVHFSKMSILGENVSCLINNCQSWVTLKLSGFSCPR